MNTTIQKWGNSQGIRLPRYILESVKWGKNEQLEVKAENGKLVIEKAVTPARKKIKELFADFDGQYTQAEIDWGDPVGKEIW